MITDETLAVLNLLQTAQILFVHVGDNPPELFDGVPWIKVGRSAYDDNVYLRRVVILLN